MQEICWAYRKVMNRECGLKNAKHNRKRESKDVVNRIKLVFYVMR